ncbi:MAG: hypothetical protein KIT56_06525 [Gammaproteobacteria bacterium]|nr:hypothetical protein [Gammaproteobacteria bacterium]MCW5583520.1 hypothetical protein [Gammaproteobacteria bacterium]
MKLYLRCVNLAFLLLSFLCFSVDAYAVDHLTCYLQNAGIPAVTHVGTTYANTYRCDNTYPSSFPAIQLSGTILGDKAGANLSGTCLSQKIASGGTCQFVLSYDPPVSGKRTLYFQISVGSLYFMKMPAITTTASAGTDVPAKKVVIYNNSNETIYPIIEAPILLFGDAWLQAQFAQTDVDTNKYIQTKIHRVYVNPIAGVQPGASVEITVPFYSQLVSHPDPTLPDQYIDWWNAMRVYIYDHHESLQAVYDSDKVNPVFPTTASLACDPGSVCEPLAVYSSTVGLPLNDPYQLTEYTFANVITSQGVPYPIDTQFVDYDISYVDHVYLCMAMEPHGNTNIGYTGTTLDIPTCRSKINQFISDKDWPIYTKTPQYPYPKVPGTYNVIIGNQPLTSNDIFDRIKQKWSACTTDSNDPEFTHCSHVKDLFDKNSGNYQSLCSQPAPTLDEYLQHVYGWVAFNCASHANDLQSTPGANYEQAQEAFLALQYDYELNPPPSILFNPYVEFIHSSTYIGMNAYAFSIDDAVGNMNEDGDGVVIAVGGGNGLPNPNAYDPSKIVNVGLGAPSGSDPTWVFYGICQPTPNKQLPTGSLTFKVQTVEFPCEVSVMDSNNHVYHFTLIASPPFVGGDKADYIQCEGGNTWCEGVNINFVTGHDVSTPPTTPLASTKNGLLPKKKAK